MRLVEGIIFLSVAAGLHVGVWMAAPQSNGAQSSGSDGASAMTLQAAAESHARLVEQWQTPPDASATPAALTAPQSTARPAPPTVDAHPARPALPERPALPDTVAAPRTDETVPLAPVSQPQVDTARPQSPAAPAPPQAVAHARTETRRMAAVALPQPDRADAPNVDVVPPTPQPPPKSASRSQPQTRAKGSAQTATPKAGGAQGQAQTAARAARANALQAEWGAAIQRKVHRNLRYPRGMSGSGSARVALTIATNGRLQGVRLVRSSGTAAFDQAALSAVRRAGRFARAPRELAKPSYNFTLSLSFRP